MKYYMPFQWKEKASIMEVPHDGNSSNFCGIIRCVKSTPICGKIIAFSMAGISIIELNVFLPNMPTYSANHIASQDHLMAAG